MTHIHLRRRVHPYRKPEEWETVRHERHDFRDQAVLDSKSSECKCAERAREVIEVIHAGNDVNPPRLATTETLTQHVNLNYFSEAVSSEVKARLPDADSWRITGKPEVVSVNWR